MVDQLSRYNGKEFECLRVGGGGAKSEKWLQLKADMFGIQLEKAKNIEVSSLGAVIMAAVSLGYFNSIEAATPVKRSKRNMKNVTRNIYH